MFFRKSGLKVIHQVAHLYAERFGNPYQGMKADPLLSPFHFADINRVQVGFFRQYFLAHARLGAKFPDAIPQNFEILSRSCHRVSAKQWGGKL